MLIKGQNSSCNMGPRSVSQKEDLRLQLPMPSLSVSPGSYSMGLHKT